MFRVPLTYLSGLLKLFDLIAHEHPDLFGYHSYPQFPRCFRRPIIGATYRFFRVRTPAAARDERDCTGAILAHGNRREWLKANILGD
jgi:hypothetical protein